MSSSEPRFSSRSMPRRSSSREGSGPTLVIVAPYVLRNKTYGHTYVSPSRKVSGVG